MFLANIGQKIGKTAYRADTLPIICIIAQSYEFANHPFPCRIFFMEAD